MDIPGVRTKKERSAEF